MISLKIFYGKRQRKDTTNSNKKDSTFYLFMTEVSLKSQKVNDQKV